MPSPFCEQAIGEALQVGKALFKFISPNDVGTTKSHQCGYYLPKEVWQVFTPHGPLKGTNNKHNVSIRWQDDRLTESVITWYGQGTRSEYRLTRFGKDFPFLAQDCVGNLLVLIPSTLEQFTCYVLDLEDDIEDLQAGLGTEIIGSWTVYDRDRPIAEETEDQCIDRHFRQFAAALMAFPSTTILADEAQKALEYCIQNFVLSPSDEKLMLCVDAEYRLFKLVERALCQSDIVRVFKSVDDFLTTAQTILQRRKIRAGRSLENHVERLLKDASIPYTMRSEVEGTRPDILIPGKTEYLDPAYPVDRLFAVGVKTTCKDRWTQVLQEAKRVEQKHILTLQPGISTNQVQQMVSSSVQLIVPAALHEKYPKSVRGNLITVEKFITDVKLRLQ